MHIFLIYQSYGLNQRFYSSAWWIKLSSVNHRDIFEFFWLDTVEFLIVVAVGNDFDFFVKLKLISEQGHHGWRNYGNAFSDT